MAEKGGSGSKHVDAKLFWNGRSQAVRLPKEFRFEGDRVRVTRMGAGVLLEPVHSVLEDSVEDWFARIDGLRGDPIFPDGRDQNLAPIREYFK
jgi:antitoxin VapB